MDITTSPPHGFAAVERFLQTHGIEHAVIEHGCTYTAAAEARVAAVPPQHVAKTVMLRDGGGYVAAVIPASELLDLRKARRLAGRPLLRFATEQALAADFPAFEVGALPPLGGLLHCPELIDTRLLGPHRILCNGGDHRHSVVLEARELQRASGGQAGDLAAARSDAIYIAAPVRKPAAR